MKKVYVAMSADLVHPGHLNIIKTADLHASIDPARLANNPVPLPPDLFA